MPVERDETGLVSAQLGREPRGSWHVAARCEHGRPVVIQTAPILHDGSPFPTLYWLTCPWLRQYVDGLESAGAVAEWYDRLRTDPGLAEELRGADIAYRERRARAGGGQDPVPGVGIAGQNDPLETKCLHAHVAAYLASIDDPVGAGVLAGVGRACPDDLCARFQETVPQ